jgi:hypothetical protein
MPDHGTGEALLGADPIPLFEHFVDVTGGSSNRVLDGALQASLYSRSAESKVMADAMFIEFSAPPSSRQAPRIRHGAPFNQCSISTTSAISLVPRRAGIDSRPKASASDRRIVYLP